MKSRFHIYLVLATLATHAISADLSACAENSKVQTVSVKIGYFNLQQVKQSYPESAAAFVLEERAKDMLKREVERGNAELADLTKANKTKEEIEKRQKELQREISIKQETLANLVGNTGAASQNSISAAVNAVARDRGLDLVVDGSGIFTGGEKFLNQGEDITPFILKRLSPASYHEEKPSSAPAPSAPK